ncbi:hypothetical protein J9303_16575 [Bacillaceae bacterium Marseille-Q3522]|nr:hypothetical protein [Bacillaceae bacterium Marseille-Q3522]
MSEYDHLLQLKEQYKNVQTISELKQIIDCFLEIASLDTHKSSSISSKI